MKKLLRLELVESIPLAALVFTLLFVSFILGDFEEEWVFPTGSFAQSGIYRWWILGLIAGAVNVLWEDFTNAKEYFLHRGLSRRQLYRVRAGGTLIFCAFVVVMPILCGALWERFTEPNGAIAMWSRLWHPLVLGSIALSSASASMWATSLPCPAGGRWLIGLGAAAAVLVPSLALSSTGPDGAPSPWLYGGFQFLTGALFYALAEWNLARASDEDHPLEANAQRVHSLLAVAGLGIAVSALAENVQSNENRKLSEVYPTITLIEGEELALLGDTQPEIAGGLVRVGPDHVLPGTDQAEVLTDQTRENLYWPWSHRANTRDAPWRRKPGHDHRRIETPDRNFEGPWERVREAQDGQAWLERSTGSIHAWTLAAGGTPPSHSVIRKPDGSGFSSRVELIGELDLAKEPGGPAFLGDPADGSFWTFRQDGADATLERTDLPGGDRYSTWWWLPEDAFAIIGEQGSYRWQKGEFEPAREEDLASIAYRAHERFHVSTEVRSPLEYTVTVREVAGGAIALQHDYAPRTGRERRHAGILLAASVLRPAGMQAVSFLLPANERMEQRASFAGSWRRDPLVAAGATPWLLALSFLLSGGLAWHARTRVRRLSADARRAWWWFGVVVVGGPAGWLVHFALESDRAWRWRERESLEMPCHTLVIGPTVHE